MMGRNALVDGVLGLSAPSTAVMAKNGKSSSPRVTVNFNGGGAGFLDMGKSRSTVWAEVLNSLRRDNQPAYVELDPETTEITKLLIPIEVKVGDIDTSDKSGDVEVELIISHSRHILSKNNPEFDGILKILQDARQKDSAVIVTENDNHEIIDVRIKQAIDSGGGQ